MHISEGILSPVVLGAGWVVTAGLMAVSMKRVKDANIPQMAVFASAFFVASLIRVPVGLTSAHFALLGLMGITLGWGAFPAIFLSLGLQALLFQFGGLVSLGVNAAIMGSSALVVYGLFGRLVAGSGTMALLGGFLAGFVAIVLGVAEVYGVLVASNAALSGTAGMMALANSPLALLEGIVTAFAVGFLRKVAPHMLQPAGGRHVSG